MGRERLNFRGVGADRMCFPGDTCSSASYDCMLDSCQAFPISSSSEPLTRLLALQELVDEGRDCTKNTLVDHSFGLGTVPRHPDDLILLPPQQSIVECRPHHEVKMAPTWNEALLT